MIPGDRFYAPGLALLNLFPLPNSPGSTGFNYTSQLSSKLPRREDLLRLDYNLSQNVRVFGHWIGNVFPQPVAKLLPGLPSVILVTGTVGPSTKDPYGKTCRSLRPATPSRT